MMKKRELGQAFLLVLIILAIGALLVVPALRLTATSVKSAEIVRSQVRTLYAVGGAQEYVLWKLTYDGYGALFTVGGQSDNFTVDVCGHPVDVIVVMRAVEGKGGLVLATDDVIRPTKLVSPSTVANGYSGTFTYDIRLERLSENMTQGLDAVYDILPKSFTLGMTYIPGSSKLKVDEGPWEPFGDPLVELIKEDPEDEGQIRLRWPNPATYGSENFTDPMRDFAVRQVKEIQFQVSGILGSEANNRVHVNWVVLDPWDTLSGPQARITVGNPANPNDWGSMGLYEIGKDSEPQIIPPGVETDIKYTVTVINHEGSTQMLQELTDYLPPGFLYTDNSTSGNITSFNPQQSLQTINGVERQVLRWTISEFGGTAVSFAAGATRELTFWARTTKDISGSYYNEAQAKFNILVRQIVYEIIGPTTGNDVPVDRDTWNTAYSWNAGAVIVPAYDSRTSSENITIDANMALILGGISITSWQIY